MDTKGVAGNMAPLLLLLLTAGQLVSRASAQGRECPAIDPECECNFDQHDILTSIMCTGLGQRDSLPAFNASDDIIPTLTISNSSIYRLQTGAFSGLKIRNLILNSLNLAVIEPQGLQGLEDYLESLEMKDNNFVTLPEYFLYNFSSLNTLAMDRNKLDLVRNNWFLRMFQLQYISLAGNKIRSIEAGSFRSLPELKVLYLTGNKLTDVDRLLLAFLTKLRELGIGSNNLSALPADLLDSQSDLIWLDLSRNQLEDIPDGFFGRTQALKEVYLSSNKIKGIRPTHLPSTTTLEVLVLSNNNISSLADTSFGNIAQLKKLALDHNDIELLPDLIFENNRELEVLNLQDNRIKELQQNILTGLLNLKELDFKNNKITTLTYGIFDPLGSLIYLDVSWNLINEVHFGPFDALRKLTYLDLSRNQLPKVEANWFKQGESLKELYLFHNVIRSIELKSFSKLPVLEKLSLDYNYIQEVDSHMFTENRELRVLSLSHNPLKIFPTGSLSSLQKLESLHLNYTCLPDLPNGFFANLFMLKELYLDHLPLETIRTDTFAPLRSISTLILGHYNITSIGSRPLFPLKNLTTFAADNMGLTVNDLANILADLPEATRISLKYNSLKLPMKDTFFFNNQLQELSLMGNPLVCGCGLAWLREFPALVDIENTACNNPSTRLAACYELPDNCEAVTPLPGTSQRCASVGSTVQPPIQGSIQDLESQLDYSHCIVPPKPTTPAPTTARPATTIGPIVIDVFANKTQVMVTWQQSPNPRVIGYRVRYRQFATNISRESPDINVNDTMYYIKDLIPGQNYFVCVDMKFAGGYLRPEQSPGNLGCKEIGIQLITTTRLPGNDTRNTTAGVGAGPTSEQTNSKSLLVIVGASAAAFIVIFLIIVLIVCYLRKTKTRFTENAQKKEDNDKMVKDKMNQWVNSFNYDGNVQESMGEQLMLDFDLFSGSNPTVSKARQAQLLAQMGHFQEVQVENGDTDVEKPPEIHTGDIGEHNVLPPVYDYPKIPTRAEEVTEEDFPGDVSGSDPGYGESETGYENTNSDSGNGDSTRQDVIF